MIATSYDWTLVILSVAVATFASYTALDLGGRVQQATGAARYGWLAAAAIAMGGGIWSMHFVAMLAFEMPMPVEYEVWLTALSLFIAIAITGIAFLVVARGAAHGVRIVTAGALMGAGILGMHYLGMAAMRMPAEMHYDPWIVLGSAVIAVAASTVALRLALGDGLRQQWAAAGAMGVAIAGMHYTGMAAARFVPMPEAHPMAGAAPGADRVALAIAAATFVILSLALVASYFDRRRAIHAEREARVLRASEVQFRAFYNKTPASMHSIDAEGRLLWVNDYWVELLGYRREDVLGRPLVEFLEPKSAEAMRRAWPAFLARNELRQFEIQCVRKSGEVVDLLLSSRIERDETGRFLRTFSVLSDVTERKRLEEQLLHAQKMEAVGQLTGGIAHDFNNLLTVIGGNLALLEQRLGSQPALVRLIRAAIRAGERGERLTEQLLIFSRRQRLRPEEFDLNRLVVQAAEMLAPTLGRRIVIETRLTPAIAPCFADATQLESAIVNLAINARDAMPEGGRLVIATNARAIAANEIEDLVAGLYLVLEVADTGTGMPPEILERALEPFFTTKEVGKGSGLGLSSAYGFAKQSGGTLQIESKPGRGTAVRMFMPRAAALPGAPRLTPPDAATAAATTAERSG